MVCGVGANNSATITPTSIPRDKISAKVLNKVSYHGMTLIDSVSCCIPKPYNIPIMLCDRYHDDQSSIMRSPVLVICADTLKCIHPKRSRTSAHIQIIDGWLWQRGSEHLASKYQ